MEGLAFPKPVLPVWLPMRLELETCRLGMELSGPALAMGRTATKSTTANQWRGGLEEGSGEARAEVVKVATATTVAE